LSCCISYPWLSSIECINLLGRGKKENSAYKRGMSFLLNAVRICWSLAMSKNSGYRYRSFKGFNSRNSVAFARRHPTMAERGEIPKPMGFQVPVMPTPIKTRRLFPETFVFTNVSRFLLFYLRKLVYEFLFVGNTHVFVYINKIFNTCILQTQRTLLKTSHYYIVLVFSHHYHSFY
jgi:hypothetical protein